MSTVLDQGREHLDAINAGSAEALAKLFSARVHAWSMPIIHDEGGTYSLFADLEEQIESGIAFSLIPAAIEIALSQTSKEFIDCALWLLLGLVEATQTTEVPAALPKSFPKLRNLASPFGIELAGTLQAIQEHYRNAL